MSTTELTGTKFFMNFPVTDTSHTLAEYRTRFGYQALEKALSMAPTDVTKEVSAAGLLGHGGAAFPPDESGAWSSWVMASRTTSA